MTSNIVSLRGGHEIVPPGVADPEVIAELERLLEMARSGEINGIAAAVSYHDDATSSRYVGRVGYGLLGQMHAMAARLANQLNDR